MNKLDKNTHTDLYINEQPTVGKPELNHLVRWPCKSCGWNNRSKFSTKPESQYDHANKRWVDVDVPLNRCNPCIKDDVKINRVFSATPPSSIMTLRQVSIARLEARKKLKRPYDKGALKRLKFSKKKTKKTSKKGPETLSEAA